MVKNLKKNLVRKASLNYKVIIVAVAVIVATSLTIMYSLRKKVSIVIDGKELKSITYKSNVRELLKKENILLGEKDKIDRSLDDKLTKDDRINIKKAVDVKVNVDGKVLDILSAEDTVQAIFEKEGIVLKEEDRVNPAIDSKVEGGMSIDITRVETKTFIELKDIDFETIVKNDDDLPKTKSKTLQEGESGEKELTLKVVFENGKEVARNIVKEVVTKEPVNKIVAQGTMSVLTLSRGGEVPYRKTLRVKATAYHAINGVGKTYTYSGRKAVRDPEGYSTIAVDPRVIPLGTRLYVEGYGYAIASDIGSGVTGDFIDVFFNTYSESASWGVKYLNVYFLD